LEATDNPLAIPMQFRVHGRPVPLTPQALAAAFPDPSARLLVMVHGSSMNDRQWLRGGHDHGQALAEELGYSAIYVHYNSGRHISTNGAELSEQLDALVQSWPGPELEQVVLLTHSMGGLVSRSACLVAEAVDAEWRKRLSALVFLGTPHHGAPLERGGNWVDVVLGVSAYSAPFARLGKIRSAGVTDLRHGSLREADWVGRDRFRKAPDPRAPAPLPHGVHAFAVAGQTQAGLAAALPGDGLVPVKSALGQHNNSAFNLAFLPEHTWLAPETSHLDLLSSRLVYEQIKAWLEGLT
ncbi:MAG: esterase/lipase family protein, partial [Myxococcota bacterium]